MSFPRYISVSERRKKAEKKINALKKEGRQTNPVIITGRGIAKTFWGKAWCKHLESYSDYENRLPRGRAYVRNGSVIDLTLSKGKIKALVQGSRLYTVALEIKPLQDKKWKRLVAESCGKIDSLVELLQGTFSKSLMEIIIDKEKGLFPNSYEIKFDCSCPDRALMCKHVAAVLYGFGARLDEKPEELFTLRQVDHFELINASNSVDALTKAKPSINQLNDSDLSSLFNIDIEESQKTKGSDKKKSLKIKTLKSKKNKT